MASTKAYLDFILEQLSLLDGVSHRRMMGEYIIYYNGKIVGGIYDDRFLVKDVESARGYLSSVEYEIPYPTAKPMLLVDNVDDKEYLVGLFNVMFDDLPSR